jgi:hypothetical protein
MNSSFTFEAEPFAGYSEMPGNFETDEVEGLETDLFIADPELADEVGNADEGGRIIDLTASADKSKRQGTRDPKKIYALVLHQMACCVNRSDPLKNYLKTGAHFVILQDGRILQLHPISAMVWASNCTSPRSVAVEFAGNFPDTKGRWWFNCVRDPKTGNYKEVDNTKCCQYLASHRDQKGCEYLKGKRNQVTPAQIEAGRYLVRYLVRTMGLKTILAHRQSSSSRENDPGPDIWSHVGQWAVDNLGLSDGGPGFKCGTGNPIPDTWRNWGKTTGGTTRRDATQQGETDHATELDTESGFCPTCGHERQEETELSWEHETPATPTYLRNFSGPNAQCVAALTRAGKTRAQALALINRQIDSAIRMLRVAAGKLKRGGRTAQTAAVFRQIFRVPPGSVPNWLRQTPTIQDRGDVVAARCRRVADLLASGSIRFFCSVNGTNCPDCGGSSPAVFACSSWGQESTAPQNSNVICLGTSFWDDMKNGNTTSLLSTLMHEPFHIYFGIYVTEHGPRHGRSVGKFGGINCIVQFVFQINGRNPPPRVSNRCAGTAVRSAATGF